MITCFRSISAATCATPCGHHKLFARLILCEYRAPELADGELPKRGPVDTVELGLLLNLSRPDRYPGEANAQICGNSHRDHFSSIESATAVTQCTGRRPVDGHCLGCAAPQSGGGTLDPNEVPPRFAYGHIE